MRIAYLMLSIATLLCGILILTMCFVLPVGSVDQFYAEHRLPLCEEMSFDVCEEWMPRFGKTIGRQTRTTVLLAAIPPMLVAIGWLIMFHRHASFDEQKIP